MLLPFLLIQHKVPKLSSLHCTVNDEKLILIRINWIDICIFEAIAN